MATAGWKASAMEADARKAAKFPEVENSLGKRFADGGMGYVDRVTSLLGSRNPFSRKARPDTNEVWLFDNTAYRPVDKHTGQLGPWQAEFVAAFFIKGRADINSAVANIADTIGLDGSLGPDEEVRKTIAQRLMPFVQQIAPARTLDVTIPALDGASHTRTLGPSDGNGISSQMLLTGGQDDSNGKTVACTVPTFPIVKNQMQFVGPEGWAVISDIDDTIKVRSITPKHLLTSAAAELTHTVA